MEIDLIGKEILTLTLIIGGLKMLPLIPIIVAGSSIAAAVAGWIIRRRQSQNIPQAPAADTFDAYIEQYALNALRYVQSGMSPEDAARQSMAETFGTN